MMMSSRVIAQHARRAAFDNTLQPTYRLEKHGRGHATFMRMYCAASARTLARREVEARAAQRGVVQRLRREAEARAIEPDEVVASGGSGTASGTYARSR